jgi:hypothetical protein
MLKMSDDDLEQFCEAGPTPGERETACRMLNRRYVRQMTQASAQTALYTNALAKYTKWIAAGTVALLFVGTGSLAVQLVVALVKSSGK